MPLILTPRQLNLRSHFYQQFGQMTAAGLSVPKTLETLERNPPAASFREPIRHLLAQISQGATVADATRSLGRWMPEFDIALIQAGEHSGRLDAVCKLLASYYEDRARMLTQMLTDVAYPAFVLHCGIFLFPMISLFNGGTLLGFVMKSFGTLTVLYTLAFSLIYAAQGRHGLAWRRSLESLLRPIPVLGTARQSLALARLAAALDALTNAGVTIIEAWTMAAAASGSPAIQSAVAAWQLQLAGGQTPAELVKSCPLFPELFGNLYYSGEISGQLDETLRRLHTYYQEDGSRKTHLLAKWVPQIIYFGVAGYIGYKVVHYYAGYFNEIDQNSKL